MSSGSYILHGPSDSVDSCRYSLTVSLDIDVCICTILLSWLVAMYCGCKDLQSVVGVSSVNFHSGMWSCVWQCLLASNLSLSLTGEAVPWWWWITQMSQCTFSLCFTSSLKPYHIAFTSTTQTALIGPWTFSYHYAQVNNVNYFTVVNIANFLCVTIREHRFFCISIKFNVLSTHYK